MKVFIYSSKFKRALRGLDQKYIDLFKQKMALFRADEFDKTLNNHKLNGKFKEYRSINILSDLRLIYRKIDTNTYLLVNIGSHSELYS